MLNFAKSGLLCQIKEYCDKLSVFSYYDLMMISIQSNNANKYLIKIEDELERARTGVLYVISGAKLSQ